MNAAQAIEDSGAITIESVDRDEQVYLVIRDTGSGIPKELQSRIFDPFFSTKPRNGTQFTIAFPKANQTS